MGSLRVDAVVTRVGLFRGYRSVPDDDYLAISGSRRVAPILGIHPYCHLGRLGHIVVVG